MKFSILFASTLALGGVEAAASGRKRSSQEPPRRFQEKHLPSKRSSKHLRPYADIAQITKRQSEWQYQPDEKALGAPDTRQPGYAEGAFAQGLPEDSTGKGGPFSGKFHEHYTSTYFRNFFLLSCFRKELV